MSSVQRETSAPAERTRTVSTDQIVDTQALSDAEFSIARLMGEMVADAQHLFRKEIELAREEMRVEIRKATQGIISLGIGAAVTAVGGLFLLLMVVYLLVDIFTMDIWLSYLIVGGLLAIIGVILLLVGRSRVQQVDPTPHETIDSVRKDVQWIKEQNPSNKT